MFRAEGWQLVRNDAEALVNGIRNGKLGQKGADAFADGCVQRFADLAEQELIANTGSPIPKEGTRCRAPNITWQSILSPSTKVEPSPSAAARWGVQAARDFTNRPQEATENWKADILAGAEEALTDAAADSDLEKMLQRMIREVKDEENLSPDEVQH